MRDSRAHGRPGRRELLAGLAAGVLAAATSCGVPVQDTEPAAALERQGQVVARRPVQPLDDTPAAPPRAAPAALPGKAGMLAEFGHRVPTEWGIAVTGVVTRSQARDAVITLDACGGPGGSGVDLELLETLRRQGVPATLFVNARWLVANPGPAADLAADPLFELANHGWQHKPVSVTGKSAYRIPGTGGVAEAYDELTGCLDHFRKVTGRDPRFFRSGTAHMDEVAAAMTRRLGMLPVNFSVNADAGATLPPQAVASALGPVRSGDIVIAHFNRPGSGTAAGFRQALPRLQDSGVRFARLGDVLSPL